MRHAERLAGIVALSTYLPMADQLPAEAAAANRDLPIFMAHGTMDPVIRPEWGEASRRALVAAGYAVEWHTYPMPHSVVWEEIATFAFLQVRAGCSSARVSRASAEGIQVTIADPPAPRSRCAT